MFDQVRYTVHMRSNRRVQICLGIAVVVVLFLIGRNLLVKDTYVGFYYPNGENLFKDVQSPVFDSLDACRLWVAQQRIAYHSDGTSDDYECGKNCDISEEKPYVCEETLE